MCATASDDPALSLIPTQFSLQASWTFLASVTAKRQLRPDVMRKLGAFLAQSARTLSTDCAKSASRLRRVYLTTAPRISQGVTKD